MDHKKALLSRKGRRSVTMSTLGRAKPPQRRNPTQPAKKQSAAPAPSSTGLTSDLDDILAGIGTETAPETPLQSTASISAGPASGVGVDSMSSVSGVGMHKEKQSESRHEKPVASSPVISAPSAQTRAESTKAPAPTMANKVAKQSLPNKSPTTASFQPSSGGVSSPGVMSAQSTAPNSPPMHSRKGSLVIEDISESEWLDRAAQASMGTMVVPKESYMAAYGVLEEVLGSTFALSAEKSHYNEIVDVVVDMMEKTAQQHEQEWNKVRYENYMNMLVEDALQGYTGKHRQSVFTARTHSLAQRFHGTVRLVEGILGVIKGLEEVEPVVEIFSRLRSGADFASEETKEIIHMLEMGDPSVQRVSSGPPSRALPRSPFQQTYGANPRRSMSPQPVAKHEIVYPVPGKAKHFVKGLRDMNDKYRGNVSMVSYDRAQFKLQQTYQEPIRDDAGVSVTFMCAGQARFFLTGRQAALCRECRMQMDQNAQRKHFSFYWGNIEPAVMDQVVGYLKDPNSDEMQNLLMAHAHDLFDASLVMQIPRLFMECWALLGRTVLDMPEFVRKSFLMNLDVGELSELTDRHGDDTPILNYLWRLKCESELGVENTKRAPHALFRQIYAEARITAALSDYDNVDDIDTLELGLWRRHLGKCVKNAFFGGIVGFGDDIVTMLVEYCENIEHLSLQDTSVTDRCIPEILDHCLALRTLDIRGSGITHTGAMAIRDNIPGVEVLH